jgi:hypothetical protein
MTVILSVEVGASWLWRQTVTLVCHVGSLVRMTDQWCTFGLVPCKPGLRLLEQVCGSYFIQPQDEIPILASWLECQFLLPFYLWVGLFFVLNLPPQNGCVVFLGGYTAVHSCTCRVFDLRSGQQVFYKCTFYGLKRTESSCLAIVPDGSCCVNGFRSRGEPRDDDVLIRWLKAFFSQALVACPCN